jgi:hypothetical protein
VNDKVSAVFEDFGDDEMIDDLKGLMGETTN